MAAFPVCPAAEGYRRSRAAAATTHRPLPAAPAARDEVLDRLGQRVECPDPVANAAGLLDSGHILAVRGVGGFHLACTEESAGKLKQRLGRIEQPFAIMVRPDHIDTLACVSEQERQMLESPVHPIAVLIKRDPTAHAGISNLHTIGAMLPYTGLHHLLFRHLAHPLLIMTSANMPGYPMITTSATRWRSSNRDAATS